jgi:phospholipid-translocating ATPase
MLYIQLCLQEYAGEGLRTLVLAYKDLDDEYYEEWAERRLQASVARDSREDRLASIYEEVESDMMVQAQDGWKVGKEGWCL